MLKTAELNTEAKGRLLAQALAAAWRPLPPAWQLSEAELETITPLLLGSGAGALGWWRVRGSAVPPSSSTKKLKQAYRLHRLESAIDRNSIREVLTTLRDAGIEPILVKGWAIARLYPEQGLRPYGDIDLCVRPSEYGAALSALKNLNSMQTSVDLHCGFNKLGGGDADAIYARSELIKMGETDVRVLGAEDNLRALCFHLLREGAWRPLWLCDVAIAIESRPERFRWELCLKQEGRAAFVSCAIGLAHLLLGAKIDDTPFAESSRSIPNWVVSTTLKEWGTQNPSMRRRHASPIASTLRSPQHFMRALASHWPNAIEATTSVNAKFNQFPRLPFQILNCLQRTTQFSLSLANRRSA